LYGSSGKFTVNVWLAIFVSLRFNYLLSCHKSNFDYGISASPTVISNA
jgi:hypothetical protein